MLTLQRAARGARGRHLRQECAVRGDEAERHVLNRAPRGQDAAEARVRQRGRQRAHQRRGEGEEEQQRAPPAERQPCAAPAPMGYIA